MATAYGRSAESKSRSSRLPNTMARTSRTETAVPASVARIATERGAAAGATAGTGGGGTPGEEAAGGATGGAGGSVTLSR
ncbi:hypothetical protein GCM10010388_39680 [Streptomyces mauvecolor]